MADFLIVSERFGPTCQGEGPSTGRPAVFLRLGLCNLECGAGEGAAWSCDTPYTWDWTGKLGKVYVRSSETSRQSLDEVAGWVESFDSDTMLVVTGGEPMIQRRALASLAPALSPLRRVEVETNGTLPLDSDLVEAGWHFNVSPKLPNSGQSWDDIFKRDALVSYADAGAIFKFVVASEQDLSDVETVVASVGIDKTAVWIMPAGTDSRTLAERVRRVADQTIERGWNLTPRLHVNIWEDERCR